MDYYELYESIIECLEDADYSASYKDEITTMLEGLKSKYKSMVEWKDECIECNKKLHEKNNKIVRIIKEISSLIEVDGQ